MVQLHHSNSTLHCRYGYTEVPDQGHSFVEMVLLTVLRKLYKELHTVIQISPELSTQFPSLASAHTDAIAAAVFTSPGLDNTTGGEPGVAVLGPVPDPAATGEVAQVPAGSSTPQKSVINKALQMTGTYASSTVA